MKGRQQGRPTKWVSATLKEHVSVGKPGVKFEVWEKWKKNRRKLGTLTISVGGLRWRPHKGKLSKQRSWDAFAEWFAPEVSQPTSRRHSNLRHCSRHRRPRHFISRQLHHLVNLTAHFAALITAIVLR